VDSLAGRVRLDGEGLLLDAAGEAEVRDAFRVERVGREALHVSLALESSIVVVAGEDPQKVAGYVNAGRHGERSLRLAVARRKEKRRESENRAVFTWARLHGKGRSDPIDVDTIVGRL